MEKESTQKIRIDHHPFLGLGWFTAWSFTIGFLHLSFCKAVFAIVLWAYYFGANSAGSRIDLPAFGDSWSAVA
jgi:hypothetical protein